MFQSRLRQQEEHLRNALSEATEHWSRDRPSTGDENYNEAIDRVVQYKEAFQELRNRWQSLEDAKVR